MKKSLLLSILLTLSSLHADTSNMSEQDLVNEFMQLNKQIEAEKQKQLQAKKVTAKKNRELNDIKKLSRTVNKLAKKLGVEN